MANRVLLHDRHVAAGARFVTVCDWDLPADYGDASAEYAAARRGVALADRGDWGVLDVTGRDRATFLHALLSNEIKALQPGQGCTAALLDVHGKVQVILTVWVLEDRIRLVMPRGLTAKISQALDHYLFSEKASFTDASDETALLMLLGPEAPATIERLTGVRPPAPAWSNLTATLGETTVRLVTGGGETGGLEVWVACAATHGPRVWDALVGGGARPLGVTAYESLRIEAGTPLFGHDVDESVLLPEIPLARETSPYLLQHAHNPVDWYPWGEEAFARARAEDKPLLLSVGYSACHWCHVMERESFEDPEIAALMNRHFVSVKVDREERPDVDQIYMQAVQSMTGHGGWPMTCFLTPDGEPFYGGTYFPPVERHGLPAFPRLLQALADAWANRRGEVTASA